MNRIFISSYTGLSFLLHQTAIRTNSDLLFTTRHTFYLFFEKIYYLETIVFSESSTLYLWSKVVICVLYVMYYTVSCHNETPVFARQCVYPRWFQLHGTTLPNKLFSDGAEMRGCWQPNLQLSTLPLPLWRHQRLLGQLRWGGMR